MIAVHPTSGDLVFEVSDANPWTLETVTEAEKELVKFKDADVNSVDVFYLDKVYYPESGGGAGGAAYIASGNDTGDNAYQNLFYIAANQSPTSNPPWPDAISFAHELLHILLNTGHREATGNADPPQAIIHGTAPNSLAVDGTKRIGPFPTDTDGAGDEDTATVRSSAKELP